MPKNYQKSIKITFEITDIYLVIYIKKYDLVTAVFICY